ALGLLALGAIHFAFVTLGRSGAPESARLSGLRGGTRTGEHRMLLTTLHIIGVCIVGFIWMNAGGLQNPAFLVAFALPVVGAIFLSRWQPYVMALIAIVLAGVVALAQVPELRWYAPELGTIGAWLASAMRAGAGAPFSG